MGFRLDVPNSGFSASPSFRHVFSRGSTALTTGGIRTEPPTKAFGGDGFEVFYSQPGIFFEGVIHVLAYAYRE